MFCARIRSIIISEQHYGILSMATNISRDSYVTRQAVPPGTVIFPDCGSDPQSGKITVQKVVKSRFDIEKAEQLSALLLSRFMLVALSPSHSIISISSTCP